MGRVHAGGDGARGLAAGPALPRRRAPEMLEGQKTVNDAAYLVEQGGPLLWVFTVLALVGLGGGAIGAPRRRHRAPGALLALPVVDPVRVEEGARCPTIPFPRRWCGRWTRSPPRAGPATSSCNAPARAIPRCPSCSSAAACPTSASRRGSPSSRPRSRSSARHELVFRFFRTADRDEAMAIARALDARFVALYGADRLRFDTAGALEPVYEDGDVRVLRVISANR